jgi:hypothetical protein
MGRATVVGLLLFTLYSRTASADWLFTPLVGWTFAGSTFPDPEQAVSSTHLTFGGSAGWWSAGVIGVEADFALAPRFLETNNELVTNSNTLTLSGNVVVAVPLSVTRESLRPYFIGGLGWMHTSIDDVLEIYAGTRNSVGMNLGGGAVGMVSPRTGFRFELRQFRSLERDVNPSSGERESLLSFWRATAGVVIQR